MKIIGRRTLNSIERITWNNMDAIVLATRVVSVLMRSGGLSNVLTMYGGHLGQPYIMGKIGGIKGGIAGILLNTGYEYLQHNGQIGGVGTRQDTVVGAASGIVSVLSHYYHKN